MSFTRLRTSSSGNVKLANSPVPFYDDPNFDYRVYWGLRAYENQSDKAALVRLLGQIKSRASLIDVSGGFGRLAPIYAPLFKSCVLTDPSARLLKGAENYLAEKDVKNVKIKKSDSENLSFGDKTFDVAIFVRVIHHLEEPEKSLSEIFRILRPGGYLVLEFANKNHILANLAALKKLDFHYLTDHVREDRRKILEKRLQKIPFYNYHPMHMENLLLISGFKIISELSVSNFRNPWLKRLIPLKIILSLEKLAQPILAPIYFGPSIFVLAQRG